ncbi:DMT family transporter [Jannaschia sp. KMU-145]|uniref:DMT family transporter n=1 Tax=Jannaschia halovivens TaxID=3388667 RepID=UPI00396B3629
MQDRPLAAAGSILLAMVIIGFIDQFVSVIAETSSVWTFHFLRSLMMLALAVGWLALRGDWPVVRAWRGVAARAAFVATAMIIYFGSLGFLPVAQAAAGLFTAPIWILIFSVAVFGLRIGPARIAAIFLGFAGVMAVLSPDLSDLTLGTFVPVIAGACYAMAAIATREWCAGEATVTLAMAVFVMLGLYGLAGIGIVAVIGAGDDFVTRGWVTPDAATLGILLLQAVCSLVSVLLLTRGYQLTEASKASVFEYSVLATSAFFGWLVWGDVLMPTGYLGLVAIAVAGAIIAYRGRTREVAA